VAPGAFNPLWEIAVRLLLRDRTDDDGSYEILLVLESYSKGDLPDRSPTLPARGPFVEVWRPGPLYLGLLYQVDLIHQA
jgi:hypothetical protein